LLILLNYAAEDLSKERLRFFERWRCQKPITFAGFLEPSC
jgi:hypothetical protein